MSKIYEIETKNGRVFRVSANNKSQEKRLLKIISDNKNHKTYETFVRVEVVTNGIHSIKQFEAIAANLI